MLTASEATLALLRFEDWFVNMQKLIRQFANELKAVQDTDNLRLQVIDCPYVRLITVTKATLSGWDGAI